MGKGIVVYDGPSELDGKPILAVLTLKSENIKTGDMAQLWIMAKDISPIEAVKTGDDHSVCGDCPLRQFLGGACYVNPGRGPQAVWGKALRGGYKKGLDGLDPQKGLKVRLGAYGDPAALPYEVLEGVLNLCQGGHVGYTHQWRNCDNRLSRLVRASVEGKAERVQAKKKGWKTFRVVHAYSDKVRGEVECLNSKRGVNCVDCLLCRGKGKDVVIKVHGYLQTRFKAS